YTECDLPADWRIVLEPQEEVQGVSSWSEGVAKPSTSTSGSSSSKGSSSNSSSRKRKRDIVEEEDDEEEVEEEEELDEELDKGFYKRVSYLTGAVRILIEIFAEETVFYTDIESESDSKAKGLVSYIDYREVYNLLEDATTEIATIAAERE
ncbi:hypothetical protein C8A01DRAFT_42084, partial [Parachaetomium inaequale]